MPDVPRPRSAHDLLVRYVFGRPEAVALVLRRVLPAPLLECLDLASLRVASTIYATPLLVRRESDLLFVVDLVVGEQRIPIFVAIEHQSTRDDLLPLRSIVYMGEIWGRHVSARLPRPKTLPFILPIMLVQPRAHGTPTRLSQILELPASVRPRLGLPVDLEIIVDDLAGSVLGDSVAHPAFRALVEITRFLLFAHKNPSAWHDPRLAPLPPLFDLVMEHFGPDDIRALWRYVVEAFEAESELRDHFIRSFTHAVREVCMTYGDVLRAEGEKRGRVAAKAEILLDVLEQREPLIPSDLRERVLATPDESRLQGWLRRALGGCSLEEVFEG